MSSEFVTFPQSSPKAGPLPLSGWFRDIVCITLICCVHLKGGYKAWCSLSSYLLGTQIYF